MIMSSEDLERLLENRLYALCGNELASSNWWKIHVVEGVGCWMWLV
jgi:hypothetical protein